jgi:hypothetical protein
VEIANDEEPLTLGATLTRAALPISSDVISGKRSTSKNGMACTSAVIEALKGNLKQIGRFASLIPLHR